MNNYKVTIGLCSHGRKILSSEMICVKRLPSALHSMILTSFDNKRLLVFLLKLYSISETPFRIT